MNIALAIAAAAAVTFFWRAVGVVFAGRITVESPAFRFAVCVAYGMIAALCLKLIVYPQGAAAEAPLSFRLAAIAATLAVFVLSRRNVVLSSWSGVGALLLLGLYAGDGA